MHHTNPRIIIVLSLSLLLIGVWYCWVQPGMQHLAVQDGGALESCVPPDRSLAWDAARCSAVLTAITATLYLLFKKPCVNAYCSSSSLCGRPTWASLSLMLSLLVELCNFA
jgi:hypothetical protein